MNVFFIIVPIGFEKLALNELSEKSKLFFKDYDIDSAIANAVMEVGGFEIALPMEIGLTLNHLLKLPTRIIMRFLSFKCRDLPKLYNKLLKLNWRQFLRGQIPAIDVTSHKSRLINTNRIKETATAAIIDYYKAYPPKKISEVELAELHTIIYIRFVDNLCTVSVDTSGDRLNIRGIRKYVGEAPIRENLASCLIYFAVSKLHRDHLTLIDPMTGAGTIPLEAHDFFEPVFSRHFAFERFPILKDLDLPAIRTTGLPHLFDRYYGFDIVSKMIDAARQNVETRDITLEIRDAVKIHENVLGDDRVVIFNPPYGQRIIPDHKLDKFYNEVLEAIIASYDPRDIFMIIPQSLSVNKIKYNIDSALKFKNGGFAVRFIHIKR